MRFPEFNEEWKKSVISSIAEVVGGGTPDTNIQEFWEGNIIWYTPSEIGKEKYCYRSLRTISENGLKNSSAKMLPKGAILLSSRATIGEASITINECSTNQGFQSLIAKDNINNEYLYYLILTQKHNLYRKACGSTFLEISASEIRHLKVHFPSKEEQTKIATFLSLIDERIETQSKIIEDLKTLINGVRNKLCQKSLPNTTLGDIAEIYQPQTISSSELNEDGEYFVYGANGIIGKYNNYNHTTEQICIACRGTCGIVNYTQKYSWINGNAMVINVDKFLHKVNKKYLYYLLSSMDFSSLISGSTQPQIVRSPIVKMKIYLPSLEKQEEISSVLDTFYKKKEIEKSILQNLKQQKKYLLQQMFI